MRALCSRNRGSRAKLSAMGSLRTLLLSCYVVLRALHRIQAIQYEVTNYARNSSGGARFADEIGIQYSQQTLEAAAEFVLGVFQQNTPAERKPVEKISLIIEKTNGVSFVIDDKIHVSTDYIGSYYGNVKREFTGLVYHEMTHIWQWMGNGTAPGGLIEGIADYVRLKANYAASSWVQPGEGDRWDQGYDVTAWFLNYCNSLRDGFVAELNKKMRSGYNSTFFVQLLGKTVDQLWTDYKTKYKSYSTTCENQVIWIF